ADLMWFVDPKRIPEAWDAVFYDEGETDFPPNAFWLRETARSYFDRALLVEIHPLVGLLVARQG
ncbi:MAG: class I SAM-dependent methyltransferase, partial [Thermotogaceae bacterium]|nr:class I SAM-dependent methyltransferase [Thermotogaceae bacterium]